MLNKNMKLYNLQEITNLDPDYNVTKMQFAKKGKATDKSVIIYNHHITLAVIPLSAYNYIVNGKSAIEWIMERYQITIDNGSSINEQIKFN